MSEKKKKKRRPSRCPKCGSPNVLRIFYGMPMNPKPGARLHYAGCSTPIPSPKWHCDECEHEW